MDRLDKTKLLKKILEKYNWQIDICDSEPKDSELLLEIIEEYNRRIQG